MRVSCRLVTNLGLLSIVGTAIALKQNDEAKALDNAGAKNLQAKGFIPSRVVSGSPKSESLRKKPELIVRSASLYDAVCDMHIKKNPKDISCPAQCPFLRAEPTRICQYKCVPASSCNSDNPLASFANPETMRCESCKVPGCHSCGETRTTCAKCQEGFKLTPAGKCQDVYHNYWTALWIILGMVGVFVVYYFLALFCLRDQHVNDKALNAGLRFRNSSIPKKRNQRNEMVQLNLWRNLMNPSKDTLLGPAIALQFRWMGAVLAWCLFGTILFLVAGMLFWESLQAINYHKPNSRKSFDACEDEVALREKEFNSMEAVFFVCLLILYLVTTVGSLWFAAKQRTAYHKSDFDAVTMKDYALLLSGFPLYGGAANVEEQRLEWIKSQPQFEGLNVVGVSICWDYRDKVDEIEEAVRKELDAMQCEESMDFAKSFALCQDLTRQDSTKSRERCGCDPGLKCVDAAFGVGSLPCAADEDVEVQLSPRPDEHKVQELLENLRTSGKLFLILGTMVDKHKALERCSETPLKFEHDGWKWKIDVEESEAEPLTVLWKGFGTQRHRFIMSVVFGCFAVFVGVILLDICFYAPYVTYIIALQDTPLLSQGGLLQGTVLGLLITVCNQIIYIIIGTVADMCGWTCTDSKDCFYCVKYTIAVFFNTCIDLATVLILAQGYSMEQAIKGSVPNDGAISVKAVAENPDYSYALYYQLTAYIFPSCMLIPFLLEPVATALLPYHLNKALIRTRPEVSYADAERMMANPNYDLSRYGDIIVNMMLVCVCMAFTYTDLWYMFVCMFISVVVIYAWDQVRLLRYTTRTVFANKTMDDAVHLMMAMPCAILAACIVFKLYGASHQGFLNELSQQKHELTGEMKTIAGGTLNVNEIRLVPNRSEVYLAVIGTFFLHIVIHWTLLKRVVHPTVDKHLQQDEEEEPQGVYQDTAIEKPANYFNTNPVNCLRSKYIYKHNPPCVFYRVGKELLLKENRKIGLYFSAAKEASMTQAEVHNLNDLKDNFKNFAGGDSD